MMSTVLLTTEPIELANVCTAPSPETEADTLTDLLVTLLMASRKPSVSPLPYTAARTVGFHRCGTRRMDVFIESTSPLPLVYAAVRFVYVCGTELIASRSASIRGLPSSCALTNASFNSGVVFKASLMASTSLLPLTMAAKYDVHALSLTLDNASRTPCVTVIA